MTPRLRFLAPWRATSMMSVVLVASAAGWAGTLGDHLGQCAMDEVQSLVDRCSADFTLAVRRDWGSNNHYCTRYHELQECLVHVEETCGRLALSSIHREVTLHQSSHSARCPQSAAILHRLNHAQIEQCQEELEGEEVCCGTEEVITCSNRFGTIDAVTAETEICSRWEQFKSCLLEAGHTCGLIVRALVTESLDARFGNETNVLDKVCRKEVVQQVQSEEGRETLGNQRVLGDIGIGRSVRDRHFGEGPGTWHHPRGPDYNLYSGAARSALFNKTFLVGISILIFTNA